MQSLSRYIWLNVTINNPSDWWFILTQQSTVENEHDKSGHVSFFHFLEALNDGFEVQFFLRIHFLHLIKDTGTMQANAAQI